MCANQLSLPPPPFQKVIIRLKKTPESLKPLVKTSHLCLTTLPPPKPYFKKVIIGLEKVS